MSFGFVAMHPPLRGCKNSVRSDFASDRARYPSLPRTSRVEDLQSGTFRCSVIILHESCLGEKAELDRVLRPYRVQS
jgi:hypothetical protein